MIKLSECTFLVCQFVNDSFFGDEKVRFDSWNIAYVACSAMHYDVFGVCHFVFFIDLLISDFLYECVFYIRHFTFGEVSYIGQFSSYLFH